MPPSYIQVYTGNGKGKTTAVLGLTLRALGAGKSVFIGQFLKKGKSSEIRMFKRIKSILDPGQKLRVEQYGEHRYIGQEIRTEDIVAAESGWEEALSVIHSGDYDIVIMDEINVALHLKLLKRESVLKLLKNKPEEIELVLTGRYADHEVMEIADLVSEIHAVKHYYFKGVKARMGIEM